MDRRDWMGAMLALVAGSMGVALPMAPREQILVVSPTEANVWTACWDRAFDKLWDDWIAMERRNLALDMLGTGSTRPRGMMDVRR